VRFRHLRSIRFNATLGNRPGAMPGRRNVDLRRFGHSMSTPVVNASSRWQARSRQGDWAKHRAFAATAPPLRLTFHISLPCSLVKDRDAGFPLLGPPHPHRAHVTRSNFGIPIPARDNRILGSLAARRLEIAVASVPTPLSNRDLVQVPSVSRPTIWIACLTCPTKRCLDRWNASSASLPSVGNP
jgi:hypothetical protein